MTVTHITYTVFANENYEAYELKALEIGCTPSEFIGHEDYSPAFEIMQINSTSVENLAEDGVGEWVILNASTWACKNMTHILNHGLSSIYDPETRYSTAFILRLLSHFLNNTNEFRVNQDIVIADEESFNKWSRQNLVDEYGNDIDPTTGAQLRDVYPEDYTDAFGTPNAFGDNNDE